jgi:hypothetical protein
MLSNIFLNVGVAFGNLEEEWVPDHDEPKNLIQFTLPTAKDAKHVDCIKDFNEILSKMHYDSTIGPDWVWDLNKAVYLQQLCESLPAKARSAEFANPQYDLVADKYQNQDTAMDGPTMNALEDEDGPTFQHKHFYFNRK